MTTGEPTLERRALGRTVRLTKEERVQAQRTFLEAFANSGIILVASRAAAVTRQGIDYWNEHDEEFHQRYLQARREADDRIRAEIHRRAVQGTTKRKTVTERGENGMEVTRIEDVTEFSDLLLIFLAKSRMPEFREKQHLEVAAGEGIEFTIRVGDGDLVEN